MRNVDIWVRSDWENENKGDAHDVVIETKRIGNGRYYSPSSSEINDERQSQISAR